MSEVDPVDCKHRDYIWLQCEACMTKVKKALKAIEDFENKIKEEDDCDYLD